MQTRTHECTHSQARTRVHIHSNTHPHAHSMHVCSHMHEYARSALTFTSIVRSDTPGQPTCIAAIHTRRARRQRPLQYAAINGHAAVVELLLSRGDSVNSGSNEYVHAPVHAHTHDEAASIRTWLVVRCSQKPLQYAARHGHVVVAKLLLSHGAYVHSRDRYRHNSLRLCMRVAVGGCASACVIRAVWLVWVHAHIQD
jgi:hypothetical protein